MVYKRPEYLKYLRELIHLRGLTINGFVFSGAGNDVVGKGKSGRPVLEEILKPFNPHQTPEWHIETPECEAIMEYIANGYRKLFDSVEEKFEVLAYPGLKIYLHGYDYVQVRSLPNKDPHRKRWAANWTGDPLRAKGFIDNETGSSVIRALIDRLNITTKNVCAAFPDRAVYVDLRGSVPPNEWADELHATSVGFQKAAQAFSKYLGTPEKDFRASTSNSRQEPRVFEPVIHADTGEVRFHKEGLRIPLDTLSDVQSPPSHRTTVIEGQKRGAGASGPSRHTSPGRPWKWMFLHQPSA